MDQISLVCTHHLRHHLHGKDFAFHAGNGQGLLVLLLQSPEPFFDHTLHPSGQPGPIQPWGCDVISIPIEPQIAAILHSAQQFNGEEWMASGEVVQCLPEFQAQAIGLRIQEGIHKGPAFCFLGSSEIHQDVPTMALELDQDLVERVWFPASTEGDFVRAVHRQDQHAASPAPPSQMIEQAERSRIRPLQIVQDHDQRLLGCQRHQHPGILFKDQRLLQLCRMGPSLFCQCPQSRQKLCIGKADALKADDQRLFGHKNIQKVLPTVDQGLNSQGQGRP